MNLKNIRELFKSEFVRTGRTSYEKRIYPPAVSQRLRNTAVQHEPALLPALDYWCNIYTYMNYENVKYLEQRFISEQVCRIIRTSTYCTACTY